MPAETRTVCPPGTDIPTRPSCIRSNSCAASSDGRLGHDHRELVAADAAADVDRADLVPEPLRDLGEDGVAREVPDPVVDRLEVVEVEDEERQPAVVALRPEGLAAERLVEVALVEEPGERVRLRELPRLAVAPRVLDRGDAASRRSARSPRPARGDGS